MAKIYKNAAELVGNTPLLEVGNLEKELGLESRILVKLEYFNPAGSAKDRIALSMIEDAEERGVLKPGAEGFSTVDGTHYPDSVSVDIYNYILDHLEEQMSGIWG